jgi:hypothetical protein
MKLSFRRCSDDALKIFNKKIDELNRTNPNSENYFYDSISKLEGDEDVKDR